MVDKYRANKRRWYEDNKEQANAVTRAWERNNRERARATCRASYWRNIEKRRESMRLRQKINTDRYIAANAWRRAQKYKATPKWANRKEIARFYQLARELSLLDGVAYHVDHIIPLKSESVCGLHVEHNLQVIPAAENIRKHNRVDNGRG